MAGPVITVDDEVVDLLQTGANPASPFRAIGPVHESPARGLAHAGAGRAARL